MDYSKVEKSLDDFVKTNHLKISQPQEKKNEKCNEQELQDFIEKYHIKTPSNDKGQELNR